MTEYSFKVDRIHTRLDLLNVTGNRRDTVIDRIYPVADRLYLRPEGEPDTADLVGRINEACDCIGIVEGPPDLRVRMLAERCDQQRDRIATLEAELGQLDAKPVASHGVNLALHLLYEAVEGTEINDPLRLAYNVLSEAFA